MNYILVFIGGGLGSLCRFGIAQWLAGQKFLLPWATILANVAACFVLGMVVGLTMKGRISGNMGFFLMAGFCGGFSTFSTFTNETFQLFAAGEIGRALGNVFLSLALCLISLYAGLKMVG